jgi:hypothetical protein
MVEMVRAYSYRGRHRESGSPLGARVGAKVLALLSSAWSWLMQFWAQAGVGVGLIALVVTLMQANSSVVHEPTVVSPTHPVVATLPAPFPIETSAVNT